MPVMICVFDSINVIRHQKDLEIIFYKMVSLLDSGCKMFYTMKVASILIFGFMICGNRFIKAVTYLIVVLYCE